LDLGERKNLCAAAWGYCRRSKGHEIRELELERGRVVGDICA
jgi:hypothetical protein